MATNIRNFPSPRDFGLPPKYREYRPAQVDATCDLLDSRVADNVLLAPTGFGKSTIPPTIAAAEQCRVLVVTATKALQDQYARDLSTMGVADVRGANAYPCPALQPGGHYDYLLKRGDRPTCDRGPCLMGMPCKLKESGCPRYDAIRAAQRADIVITNYSLWLSHGKMLLNGQREEETLGQFDYVFFDEGHGAADKITDAMRVELTRADINEVHHQLTPPWNSHDTSQWQRWANEVTPVLTGFIDSIENEMRMARMTGQIAGHVLDYRSKLLRVWSAVNQIANMQGRWVVQQPFGTKDVELMPVWSDEYAADMLFRGIPRRVFMSATISPRHMTYLGLHEGDFAFHEYPSSFPVARRPVYQMPVVRVHYKMSPSEERILLAAHDNWLRQRDDRRFLTHSVSYKRARWIVANSKYKQRMMQHAPNGTAKAVEAFKRSRYDVGLVSPAVVEGYDFPYEQCELVLIPKVPYPDPSSELMKARTALDQWYRHVYAAEKIVQMAGRAMRAEDDQCEVAILDSTFGAFTNPKNKEMMALLPMWFRQAIRFTRDYPKVMKKLKRK